MKLKPKQKHLKSVGIFFGLKILHSFVLHAEMQSKQSGKGPIRFPRLECSLKNRLYLSCVRRKPAFA